ncbi:MAG TPA: carbohydrate ABC transporter permease [Thermomicrobiales bacterium]|jgi:multiple sugar transport system permease protein|nr:carbohydrate ABC transporter permease [Thermomicrobiales bacterium]
MAATTPPTTTPRPAHEIPGYGTPYRKRRITTGAVIRETLYYGILIVFGAIFLLPFLWSVSTSLKPDSQVFTDPIQWIPTSITFDQYRQAFETVPFGRYFLNTFLIAGIGVASNLLLGSLAGFAFALLNFPARTILFRVLLSSMMIPGVVTLIPTYIILRSFPLFGGNDIVGQGGLGLLNTLAGVILPGAAGVFAVFLMRQFFLTLPSDLGEAARLDGASEMRIFWQIYLPLCKPALATLAIFTFQAGWNAFLFPLVVLNDPDLATVQMGLAAFTYNNSTDFGPLMAASVITTLPMIALYVYAQRYFNQGIAFTGNK